MKDKRMLRSTYYRTVVYSIVLFTFLSIILSIWLHMDYNVTPVSTSLTPTQYMRLVRRGVTAPPLLSRPHNYSLAQSDAFCEELPVNQQKPYFVFLMIISSWQNSEQRDHIRATWARYKWFKGQTEITYSYKFILSQRDPERNYTELPTDLGSDDILLSDMQEHYYLLDMKVMWGFSQVLQLHNFHFLLKCDDDTFVNLYRLPAKLVTPRAGSSPYLYGGHPLETHHWSGESINYAAGSGYVLNRKALCAVVLAHAVYSLETPRIPIEDAYTGLLNSRMGIKLVNFQGFATEHESCKDFTTVIFHHINMRLFKKLLHAAVNGTHFC